MPSNEAIELLENVLNESRRAIYRIADIEKEKDRERRRDNNKRQQAEYKKINKLYGGYSGKTKPMLNIESDKNMGDWMRDSKNYVIKKQEKDAQGKDWEKDLDHRRSFVRQSAGDLESKAPIPDSMADEYINVRTDAFDRMNPHAKRKGDPSYYSSGQFARELKSDDKEAKERAKHEAACILIEVLNTLLNE
jgi:hypothetical protein